MKQSALPPNDQEMTLVQHLLELRNAVTKSVIAVAVMFLILFPFANDIYTFIAEPLTRYLPDNTSMIAVGVASPFLTPFKLSLVLAIYIAMPFLLYQLWSFIAPALYSHEKQLIGPVLFFSSFLFYAGGAFSYFVVFPLVFGFLSQTAPDGVTIATDIALYLDFVIKMFFAFGLAFEVPVITVLLILTGMVKPKTMSHARPYVIVAAFVLGMLLTPPDIISQTLLAVPVWLLYELGIIIGTIILKRKGLDKDHEEDTAAATSSYEHEPSTKSYQGSAQKFDRGFAEQTSNSSDEDFDFDNEFDKIEQEMAALREQPSQEKSNNPKDKPSDDEQEPKRPTN
ncbi:twin-arginine translocase subunit TatC [Thiomicrospira sp. ALE5]|uniref:twin-arginine translocase subunit TatC n=1 Tax=Thiomicrospira sp. ALE5 TaxID=748650 RepID=UPI0008EA083C|nr:twin-arginine translocase subunit TatC [Thiomicrospira sp. ALE5]SFR55363.1 sec-independent protein translocase protein TatC [Thiomicrospira sp. ALE5]